MSSPLNFPAGHVEAHLRYPHCWVWLTASQLFGQLFAAHKPEELVAVWRGEATGAPPAASATTFIANRLDKKVKLQTSVPLVFSHPFKASLTQMFSFVMFRCGSWPCPSAISCSQSSSTQHPESRCETIHWFVCFVFWNLFSPQGDNSFFHAENRQKIAKKLQNEVGEKFTKAPQHLK